MVIPRLEPPSTRFPDQPWMYLPIFLPSVQIGCLRFSEIFLCVPGDRARVMHTIPFDLWDLVSGKKKKLKKLQVATNIDVVITSGSQYSDRFSNFTNRKWAALRFKLRWSTSASCRQSSKLKYWSRNRKPKRTQHRWAILLEKMYLTWLGTSRNVTYDMYRHWFCTYRLLWFTMVGDKNHDLRFSLCTCCWHRMRAYHIKLNARCWKRNSEPIRKRLWT